MNKARVLLTVSVIAMSAMTAVLSANAAPKPAFTSQNYSGVYTCKGNNESVGNYEVTTTLKLKRLSSYAKFGTYDFLNETSNSVIYSGQAVADGNRLALTYRLNDKQNANFTTGIAEVKKNAQSQWSFHNYYYEADDTGGNYGHEHCVMKTPSIIAKPAKKAVSKPANKQPSSKDAAGQSVPGTPAPTTSDFIPQTPE